MPKKGKMGTKAKFSHSGLKKRGTVGIAGITKKHTKKGKMIQTNPSKRSATGGTGKRVF